MAMNKIGISISEMQRLLEINGYKTAWLRAHKVRKTITDRDAQYSLAGLVELDDSFFGPKGGEEVDERVRFCAQCLFIGIKQAKNGLFLPV